VTAGFAAALFLLVLAPSSLADTGRVYFDANNNVGAGSGLFPASFTGTSNVGIGLVVMPNT
jgi:hypothetical protein